MWQAVDLKKLVRLRKKIPHYATSPYSAGLWVAYSKRVKEGTYIIGHPSRNAR